MTDCYSDCRVDVKENITFIFACVLKMILSFILVVIFILGNCLCMPQKVFMGEIDGTRELGNPH